MTRDPLGEAGGINLYGFVGNDPLNSVDPLGLSAYGFIIKLSKTGFKNVKPIFSKKEAVKARKKEQNVKVRNRQTAHEIENASSGGKEIIKHKGHPLDDGRTKGRPHYQTPGKEGHTFWGIVGFIGTIFDPFDLIGGEFDDTEYEDYRKQWLENNQSTIDNCKY
jgi:uncharacterized protein RhaS with RHS repeats